MFGAGAMLLFLGLFFAKPAATVQAEAMAAIHEEIRKLLHKHRLARFARVMSEARRLPVHDARLHDTNAQVDSAPYR
jgi:hypothetical protein